MAPSGEHLQGEGPPDQTVGNTLAPSILAAYILWAKPNCYCCPAWQSVCRVIAALRGKLLYIV